MEKEKYNINDFKGSLIEERVLVAIANELANIHQAIWELKEKSK